MSMNRRPAIHGTVALLAALLLAGAGCSSGSSSSSDSGEGGAQAPASAGGPDQSVALDFSLPEALSGASIDMKRFDGTIRVVDFWATWCPPCRTAIPWLNELHRKYKDHGVSVIGISVDENAKALAAFDKEVHIEYASLLSSEEAEKAFGGIVGLPTTFVLDRSGKVVRSYVGEVDKRELEAEVLALQGIR